MAELLMAMADVRCAGRRRRRLLGGAVGNTESSRASLPKGR